jgi:hypothetical protein
MNRRLMNGVAAVSRHGVQRQEPGSDQVGPRIACLLRKLAEPSVKGGGGAADRTSAKAAEVTAVLSKRCRAVLMERRR